MLGYTPLGADTPTPREHIPHRADTPLGAAPRDQVHLSEPGTPPGLSNPPGLSTHPGKHTLAYGQRAAGTHPTGMHYCFDIASP